MEDLVIRHKRRFGVVENRKFVRNQLSTLPDLRLPYVVGATLAVAQFAVPQYDGCPIKGKTRTFAHNIRQNQWTPYSSADQTVPDLTQVLPVFFVFRLHSFVFRPPAKSPTISPTNRNPDLARRMPGQFCGQYRRELHRWPLPPALPRWWWR